MRERELLFNDYLTDLRHKEKNEKHQKKEQVRKNFHASFNLHMESKISHNLLLQKLFPCACVKFSNFIFYPSCSMEPTFMSLKPFNFFYYCCYLFSNNLYILRRAGTDDD